MASLELAHIDHLARIDTLIADTRGWTERSCRWRPVTRSQRVVARVMERVDTLRLRFDTPLVVATFGGTGTGKSSLVNALLGEEAAVPGRQRPTTKTPTLIVHPETDLEYLELRVSEFDIKRCDSSILKEVVLIDCPDPDTSDDDSEDSSNLAILRSMLPHCDVLIYTSTQQKYRSARVVDELIETAAGCRLVFVQTHADRDDDIRDDWSATLQDRITVPDIFFADSTGSLEAEQAGQGAASEIRRLRELILEELTTSERARIRRGNLADLLSEVLSQADESVSEARPKLAQLSSTLDEADQSARTEMAQTLEAELIGSQGLWERRMISAVCDRWGASPFTGVLRLYNGLGSWLASLAFFRARNVASAALLGGAMAVQHLRDRSERQKADALSVGGGSFELSDSLLRERAMITSGAVREAGFDPELVRGDAADRLRSASERVEQDFLATAARQIDKTIDSLAERQSRLFTRVWYETLFLAYVVFVLYRAGKNFFYESFWLEEEIFGAEFYLPATIFFVLWSGLLVILFARSLRRGLAKEISQMTRELADSRFYDGLFPLLRSSVSDASDAADELSGLRAEADTLRSQTEGPSRLGRVK